MRSVLCYGDSNTYGAIPGVPDGRMRPDQRWPGVLRANLGPDWLVIEEGLSGRTTLNDDPIEGSMMNGRTYLKPCITTHKPLDLIVIMLGTNDLKIRFNKTASEIALSVGALVQDIKDASVGPDKRDPRMLIVSPPPILEDLKGWDSVFEGGREKSFRLAEEYARVADVMGVMFLDAGLHSPSSLVDGFHLDAGGARSLGLAVLDVINSIDW